MPRGGVQGTCSSAHHYLHSCSSEHSGVPRNTPPTPWGPFSSSIASIPASPTLCRAVCRGSKPCLGKGLSAGCVWGGVFDEGVHGGGPLQWGYHSCPQQGQAAAPPLAAQAPCGCAGASPRPRPERSVQQTTRGLLVASHTVSPTSNPIHHGTTTLLE